MMDNDNDTDAIKQVEHPVTEMITHVNLPAAQLQVRASVYVYMYIYIVSYLSVCVCRRCDDGPPFANPMVAHNSPHATPTTPHHHHTPLLYPHK